VPMIYNRCYRVKEIAFERFDKRKEKINRSYFKYNAVTVRWFLLNNLPIIESRSQNSVTTKGEHT
jgi:hypothetical protein